MEGHANSSEFANEILTDTERIQRILIVSVFVILMTKLMTKLMMKLMTKLLMKLMTKLLT